MKADNIIEKLKSIGVEPLVVLHREKTAGTGDYYDEDWDTTYDYALIVKNEEKLHENDNLSDWYSWCDSNGIDCMLFDEDGCVNGMDSLVEEMKVRDGATIIKDLRSK